MSWNFTSMKTLTFIDKLLEIISRVGKLLQLIKQFQNCRTFFFTKYFKILFKLVFHKKATFHHDTFKTDDAKKNFSNFFRWSERNLPSRRLNMPKWTVFKKKKSLLGEINFLLFNHTNWRDNNRINLH